MSDCSHREFSATTKELGDKIVALTLKQAKELSDYLEERPRHQGRRGRRRDDGRSGRRRPPPPPVEDRPSSTSSWKSSAKTRSA